jgi:hypothetical protein
VSERAEELARRFSEAHQEFLAFVETIPEEQWLTPVSVGDPRSVGVVVQHVAWVYSFEQRYFKAIAEEHPLPPVVEFDTMNAELARHWESLSKSEVLQALATEYDVVAAWIPTLTDEQLQRSGRYWIGKVNTVDGMIEGTLAWHPGAHLQEIRAAIENAR